ncbi:orphan G-protein coupled receptor 27 [Plakobranchus ocellatus]|uniref:Orphan G-protein coupled receptor 27 n=1 Tax=Plakobranchus ocellatus TaxID=259542 RepID=A0AAV3XWS5_9GAST|nr:orphan G-protein coupled receptor 27 [Plakobranchus ocellatus]
MVSVGWGVAGLCSAPLLYVFHVRYDDVRNVTLCENIFRNKPKSHRQAFLTYAALVNFLIPLIILGVCYVRIFLKIARKASDSRTTKRQSFKPGKIHLTSNTTSATLHSAKIKTLRMTFVIVTCFIVCGAPYFFAEMMLSYGNFKNLSSAVYGVLGGIAVANSALNPYIFLLFSVNMQCLRNLKLCPVQTGPNGRNLMYNGSVRSREYSSAAYSRTPVTAMSTTDAFEMTSSNNHSHSQKAGRPRWSSNTRH